MSASLISAGSSERSGKRVYVPSIFSGLNVK